MQNDNSKSQPRPQTHCIEKWRAGADGHWFYTRTYVPTSRPKAVLLFVHGFADHITRYGEIHSRFAQRDIAVFTYDMRGFGRTALDEEHRSRDEYYGKTNRTLEMMDLQWWIHYVARTNPNIPIFVMGHSAGAGMVLAFATREEPLPADETLQMVSGIISQCPLVHLTYPTPKILRYLVGQLTHVAPYFPLSAPMPETRFSRDPAVVQSLTADTLRLPRGTVLGLHEMLSQGEELLAEGYKRWPADLPLFMAWGTADEVNSPEAGVDLFHKINTKHKKLVILDGALHDLLHETDDITDKIVEEYISWIDAQLT